MHNQNIIVTELSGGSSASYRVEHLGQPGLDFTASGDGAEILHSLAEAFRQGDAWLGFHKFSDAQMVSARGLDDPHYDKIEHWAKSNRNTKACWNELVVIRAIGQQRLHMVFCIVDVDLALDVSGALGDAIEVYAGR